MEMEAFIDMGIREYMLAGDMVAGDMLAEIKYTDTILGTMAMESTNLGKHGNIGVNRNNQFNPLMSKVNRAFLKLVITFQNQFSPKCIQFLTQHVDSFHPLRLQGMQSKHLQIY